MPVPCTPSPTHSVVRAQQDEQSWTVSEDGLHITTPGSDVTHDWSRLDEVVVRPALVQFRIGRCSLSLPRRCMAQTDLPVIEALAAGADVPVRTCGRSG